MWSSRSAPVGAAPRTSAHADDANDEQQDHGADERHDDLGDDRVAGDGEVDVEQTRQHPTQEGPDHAGDDVAEQAEVASHGDPAGERAGQEADQDPDDDGVDVEADVDHRGISLNTPFRA